jgi:dephospho-CoA kinase
MRVGLTGGIGSGKSTVAHFLAQAGATVVDADALSRATTAAGGSAIAPLRAAFGPGMITPDGALDRQQMRDTVFHNADARRLLESIVHPLVGEAIEAATQNAIDAGAACVVLDIPLLVESARWRPYLQRVVVVDCSTETQVARVMQRSGLTAEQVAAVIKSQAPRRLRLAAADHVIFNEGMTLLQLEALTAQLGAEFGL